VLLITLEHELRHAVQHPGARQVAAAGRGARGVAHRVWN
jgi:hypothetical protein